MGDRHVGDRIEDRLNKVNDRLSEAEAALTSLKSDLISEVAKRRRAENGARLFANQLDSLQVRHDQLLMPAAAWNEMRANMLGGQTGASTSLGERPQLAYFPNGLSSTPTLTSCTRRAMSWAGTLGR
jgi:hypothetical protein